MIRGYKFVRDDLKSAHGDHQWKIGEWAKAEGDLKLCKNGFHASETALDSLNYVYGDRWFIAEARGEIQKDNDKFVAREMRLMRELSVSKILVPFAIACAKRCYKNWKKQHPKDKCVMEAIRAAEKCLADPSEENIKVVWSAASAARSAESAASAARSAAWSAESAARSAAWSAESAASAARSAESAARSVAWSAGSAAWSAAGSAAWSAAWSATQSAERMWQRKRLRKLIRAAIHKQEEVKT